jgi:glutamate-1-semialdehyde aminotransferase
MTVAGFTSTGSKRPDLLFGSDSLDVPQRLRSVHGCIVQDTDGREYLDFIMGLGAVALGYGDARVTDAVIDAARRGAIGPLAPEDEPLLAAELAAIMPWLEEVRFLKTGAEAVAAAVRIARVATGRDRVLGCGYHGWLDWSSSAAGVPAATQRQFATIPFNDADSCRQIIRAAGDQLACVVIEPVIDAAPSIDWLTTLRAETATVGAILIFDEIKTAFRMAVGGVTELSGVEPDLMVLGKAIANGYPLAVVGGRRAVMAAAQRTWISSTMATEFVSLAAARATIAAIGSDDVPRHIGAIGGRLLAGLAGLAAPYQDRGIRVAGVPAMCYLHYDDEATSARVAAECARRGLLFKRTAYNFVSLAHDAGAVDRALDTLHAVLAEC